MKRTWLLCAAAVLGAPGAFAHFYLIEPQSTLVEDKLGDPQKLGPCGGTSADPGTPTNVINKVQGGQKLHIKLQETVFHPGHYRIALALKSRSELPPDSEVVTRNSERGPSSVSAKIQTPKPPVLADGLFTHKTRPAAPFETDLPLPNITCEKCTLQIIEFMAEHGLNKDGGFFYHHCADLQIVADPAKPIDPQWTSSPQ
ncbi:MAG: hypothetical protein JO323_06040 [Acidobacteriia bacterium]|nr:hypothetical protein [Terriglobia bacterium]